MGNEMEEFEFLEALRALIDDGLNSGVSDRTVEDIWAEVMSEIHKDQQIS